MPYTPQPVRSRQGISSNRDSDRGPIPEAMLSDLRHLLWTMEKASLYWAIGMGLLLGAVFIAGIIVFATADASRTNHSSAAIGTLALGLLIAMAYSPFFNRWFEDKLEARWLREALYPRTLEDRPVLKGQRGLAGQSRAQLKRPRPTRYRGLPERCRG